MYSFNEEDPSAYILTDGQTLRDASNLTWTMFLKKKTPSLQHTRNFNTKRGHQSCTPGFNRQAVSKRRRQFTTAFHKLLCWDVRWSRRSWVLVMAVLCEVILSYSRLFVPIYGFKALAQNTKVKMQVKLLPGYLCPVLTCTFSFHSMLSFPFHCPIWINPKFVTKCHRLLSFYLSLIYRTL